MDLTGDLKFDIDSPGQYIGSAFTNAGLYTRDEINKAKYSKFSRFGRVIDGQGRLNNTNEYLFFVKPDLHIVESGTMSLNPELSNNDFFIDLVNLYPDVVRELQLSASGNNGPFGHLLSFTVNNSLDLPGIEASVIDNSSNMFGASIEYLGNAESSDNGHSFSLEFIDSKELEVYQFFKAYQEYQIARKSGLVTPPQSFYTLQRRLHNVMGCYKFLVAEDMETIIHWSYLWGVFPISAPREAFSDSNFNEGNTFSANFKAAFVDDMKPIILQEFNQKMNPLIQGKNRLYIHEMKADGTPDFMGNVNGLLPTAAYVSRTTSQNGHNGRPKYKLEWYY